MTGYWAIVALAAVGEGFAVSLRHVLWVSEAWVGIIVTATAAVVVLWCLIATRGQRKEPLRIVITGAAEIGDAEPEQCPWCHTRECIDKTLCNCAEWCGSWLCEVKEASRG